jgi:hypothetical protein
MKPLPYALAIVCLLGLETAALAQAQGTAAGAFQVTKITKNLITNPQFTYTGAQQYTANQREPWLEVEVEFTSTAEFTDDLTLKYFILINGKVLSGEVNHINVAAGKGHRSVMYVPPLVLTRFNANRPVTPTSVPNIAVQLVQQGAVRDEASLTRAPAQWYAALPQIPGLLLNKNETPFGPLYWDRYEQIKAVGR